MTMKIQLVVKGERLCATLADNPTARDFYALLPQRFTLKDYAQTEKIAYLPRKLTTDSAPPGAKGRLGDICYYAPWGNLAIFYRDFGYAAGLIPLAHIGGDLGGLIMADSLEVVIEAAE